MLKTILKLSSFILVLSSCGSNQSSSSSSSSSTKIGLEKISWTPIVFSENEKEIHFNLKHLGLSFFQKNKINFNTNKKVFVIWAEIAEKDTLRCQFIRIPGFKDPSDKLGKGEMAIQLVTKRNEEGIEVNFILNRNHTGVIDLKYNYGMYGQVSYKEGLVYNSNETIGFNYLSNGYNIEERGNSINKEVESAFYIDIKMALFESLAESSEYFKKTYPESFNEEGKRVRW